MENKVNKDRTNFLENESKKGHSEKKRRLQEKDFTIDLSGRHVFGAYFNMARTNFIKTINYILPIVGVKGSYAENQVNKMLHALFLIQANRDAELTQEQLQWKKKLILNPEQQTRLQRLLFKHFPVLRPMMADVAEHKAYLSKKKSNVTTEDEAFEQLRGISLADCLENVLLIARTLTECRNTYTHGNPYNTPSQWAEQYLHQSLLAKKLDKVIVASRRVLKDREGLTVNELEFLTGIDHLKQVEKHDENGNAIIKNGKKLKTFKEYDDFYFKITGNREVKGITMAEGLSIDSMLPALSDFGLLYFCVQFLSKPYAKLFMDEARLFEFSPFSDNENVIMQEMMCIYRVLPPKLHRIDSHDNKSTLAMDIFGELGRCPIELYELLNDKTGQPFFHDEVKRSNAFTPEISKRLRYTDRFPQLALRYVDENDLFKRIRFQLQLGAFRYKFYDKNDCIDGRVRVRRIQKDINGYGRPQEVNEKRFETWAGLIQKREERSVKLEHEELYIDLDQFLQDTAESIPYVTDRRPSYNIHANRIGMYWEESKNPQQFKYFDKKDKLYIPELKIDENRKASVQMPAPRATLSVYDLPGMLFYEYLRSLSNADYPTAEQIIIDCESEYHRFFSAVTDGTLQPFAKNKELRDYLANNYSYLRMADIPEKLRLFLSGKRLTHNNMPETARQRLVRLTLEHLEEREQQVQRRLEHYEEDRKKIGEKDNKYGKKNFADVRHGALARYLAQSMMEWQPSKDGEGHDKLTGLNYNVLTAYLATFGATQPANEPDFTPRSLKNVLTKARLINSSNPHPFLPKVLSHVMTVNAQTGQKLTKEPRNIEEFYLFYLEEELKHIRSRKQSLESNASDKALAALPFIHHLRVRFHEKTADEIKSLASRYTTIQLPDGLFTPHIVKLLKTEYADNEALQQALNLQMPNKLNPVNNAAYLITQFYQRVLGDNSQPFYMSDKVYSRQSADDKVETFSFKRAYKLFTILADDKEKTFPFELKPLFLSSDDIQARISATIKDETGDSIAKIDKKGRKEKDTQGNTIWLREIKKKIDIYVNSRTDKDLKISPKQSYRKKEVEREQKREELRTRLNRMINEVKDNERTLRRFKTQDMVLFLLAKDMFGSILTEQNREINWGNFMLNKVCDNAFLRQTLTFQIPITICGKPIYVEQENMSIKNYGEFYRFLTDDRLMSLLENIVGELKPDKRDRLVIRHTDLMSELAAYDQKRSTVFKLIQQIEALIIKGNDFLNKPDSNDFWAKPGLPKRNNFASLLALIDHLNQTTLTTEERTLLVAIRNAFSHNSYNINLSLIAGVKHLPEVANSILRHLETMLGEPQK